MMKKMMVSITLGMFLFGVTQQVSADEEIFFSQLEPSPPFTRVNLRPWFKSIPPLKYKGKTRINYYPKDGGYIGVYL